MKGNKIWCRIDGDEIDGFLELDLDHKTLNDFRCEKCQTIHRKLLSLRELNETRHCEFCGGLLLPHQIRGAETRWRAVRKNEHPKPDQAVVFDPASRDSREKR